jgi:hypothetical protein
MKKLFFGVCPGRGQGVIYSPFSIGNCVEELEGNSLLVEDIYMQNYIIRGNPCRNKFPRL